MKRIAMSLSLASLLASLLVAGACATAKSAAGPAASAVIEPRSGSSVTGTVNFADQSDGVAIEIHLTGLTPGNHGIHLHEKGDCSAPDASSAGPHFNPGNVAHGGPNSPQHHAGDWGNVTADANGEVNAHIVAPNLTTAPGANSVVGRAVVVHADQDDLTSQPAGNSGKRIGCGVVTLTPTM